MKERIYLFGSTVKPMKNPKMFDGVYKFPTMVSEFLVYTTLDDKSYGMLMFYNINGIEKKVSVKISEEQVMKFRRAIGR